MARSLLSLLWTNQRAVSSNDIIVKANKGDLMKPHIKTAAISAANWALGLSAGLILGPIVIGLAGGGGITEKVVAEKLVFGIAFLPLLFLGLWVWGILCKKDPMAGATIQPGESTITSPTTTHAPPSLGNTTPKKPSPWNYVCLGIGVFMLLFLFLPEIINGTLANQYYLGAAFWVGVIIYCALNISRVKQ